MKHFIHLSDFSKQEIKHIFELADKLNIGIKVFDEAHNRYKMFNEIDLNMQVDETIYVTATPGRSRTEEDKMYAKMRSEEHNV